MYAPWTSRKVGVEMEVTARDTSGDPFEALAFRDALRALHLPTYRGNPGYFHSDGTTWDVKTDSSCGYEIASPALTLDPDGHHAELREVTTQLAAFGARVSRNCGLHIHVDCSDFDDAALRRLVTLWARYEPTWYSCVPQARRINSYCEPVRASRFTTTSHHWSRFRAALVAPQTARSITLLRGCGVRGGLNLLPYWQHARVEFRLHSGTINYDKVRYWAALCASIVHRAKTTALPPIPHFTDTETSQQVSMPYVGRLLGLLPSNALTDPPHPFGGQLVQYLTGRVAQFA